MKKALIMALFLTIIIPHHAESYCAYNQSPLTQRWYISPDASGQHMLDFLKGFSGIKIALHVLNIIQDTAGAVARTIATEGASAPSAIFSITKSAVQNGPSLISTSIDLKKLKKILPKGSTIFNPRDLIGNLGRLIDMSVHHIRWGKVVKPGGKECWNKKEVKKTFKLPREDSPMYFFVIGYDEHNSGRGVVALSEPRGIHEGIVAN